MGIQTVTSPRNTNARYAAVRGLLRPHRPRQYLVTTRAATLLAARGGHCGTPLKGPGSCSPLQHCIFPESRQRLGDTDCV